jgi:acyl-CoA hydrolase
LTNQSRAIVPFVAHDVQHKRQRYGSNQLLSSKHLDSFLVFKYTQAMNESLQKRDSRISEVEMTEICLPQHANAVGSVFGGQIMSWIDICAAVAAQRHCLGIVVTASIDAVHFLEPIRVGDQVILKGRVNAAFSTSVECGVSVWKQDPMTGVRVKAGKAYATFVALNTDGSRRKVPPLHLESQEDHRRALAAHKRREQRLSARAAQTH